MKFYLYRLSFSAKHIQHIYNKNKILLFLKIWHSSGPEVAGFLMSNCTCLSLGENFHPLASQHCTITGEPLPQPISTSCAICHTQVHTPSQESDIMSVYVNNSEHSSKSKKIKKLSYLEHSFKVNIVTCSFIVLK